MLLMKKEITGNFQLRKLLFLILTFLLSAGSPAAQSGNVDLSFNAAVSTDLSSGDAGLLRLALQPDGKVIAFGSFQNVNGTARNKIIRLNSDGTVDNTFSCTCENFTSIGSVLVQPDGKLIVAGSNLVPGSFGASPRIARLNSDGSVDGSFVSPFSQQGGLISYSVSVLDIQADGKLFVLLTTAGQQGVNSTLYRLNTNGSFDNSFASMFFGSGSGLARLQVLPDGKIMMSGNHNFGYIFRVNPDGTKDNSFESPSLVSSQQMLAPFITDFGFQSDGKIVAAGNFSSVNGVSRMFLARLNAGGSLDLTFENSNPAVTNGTNLEILSNDKILIRTQAGAPNSVAPYFFRLNADGTPDNTFSAAATPLSWRVDSLDRIVFTAVFNESGVQALKVARMNSNGSIDNTFSHPIFGVAGEVRVLARQSDGKVILGGFFNRVNGVIQRGLARVNADGSLDNTFNAGTGVGEGEIKAIAVQPDGKILVGGNFQIYNGTPREALVRLNSDGSPDAAFNPVIQNYVNAVALQTDGKILIGGSIGNVNGVNRFGVARLNSDGTNDNAFNPIIGSADIRALLFQTDGKIMLGGSFTGVNGFNRSNFVRLNSDGTLDAGFNAGSVSIVNQIIRLSDGKYLVLSDNSVLRRNADGSADGSFTSAAFANTISGASLELKRMLLQPDGNIIVVGAFTKVGTSFRNNIARLSSDGAVDALFFPVGADRRINDIIAQPDGKLIIGGLFSSFENVPRSGIARITASSFRRIVNFDYDGDGRADISVFRASENKWYVLRSSDGVVVQQVFAIAGDVPVPADYDGDSKTDFAIFRPSSGDWWYLSSLNGAHSYTHWGASGDSTRPSDYDGDGRADFVLFRPSNSFWYRISSANGAASNKAFGLSGDKAVTGDFDGDGKSDVAIFRPSTGDWWWQSSLDNVQRATHWGISTDVPAPADYDGDGKTDFAVYRPSTGTWYVYNSATLSSTIMNFGIAEDKPVPADYDGDGKADIAVFRPSTGTWYLMKSTEGFTALQFGISTDIPTPNAFVP